LVEHSYEWQTRGWIGRPWHECVFLELHVGTFSEQGTFRGAIEKLDRIAAAGFTAIELMPVADFPGRRNWGYDGVFPFAPDSSYGHPEDLKKLIQTAHAHGIMVLLDVVYNHFGPEGNYLNSYAPQFFTDRHRTPWGKAINFDGPDSRAVRDFFIHNALYWLTEYHLDGLRLDAVHAIMDDSTPHFLVELAEQVRKTIDPHRHIHLVLENELNQARYLHRTQECKPKFYDAQWNDDIHHALHVLVTGEKDGYYSDHADRPLERLGRCLCQGFDYQGEVSLYRNGQTRGEPTTGLSPAAFVSFLQNHDQVGNRAFGERITTIADARAVRAAVAILLLAPSPPLLFMGEEFGVETPFLFFCDFEKSLAPAVAAGRRNEFARFARFNDPSAREGIPDPNAATTFKASKLDWHDLAQPRRQEWFSFYRDLLQIRSQHILSRPLDSCAIKADYELLGDHGLIVRWEINDGSKLTLLANLGTEALLGIQAPNGKMIYATQEATPDTLMAGTLPPWSVAWFLES
jgi:malto-oligosyltrehalose trehalohydrolase